MNNKNLIEYTNEVDPFNPNNRMTCTLCTEGGKMYGSLEIHSVNGYDVSLPRTYGTPKLAYPFNKVHKYKFPSAHEIRSYEKYDGTNVFMYKYQDHTGMPFITFKVRLFPFLRGQFVPMWKRIIQQYPKITKLFNLNPDISGFSFELFGSDNTHLISYKERLDTRLLFGVRNEGEIVPPDNIACANIVPTATFNFSIDKDYIWYYEQEQNSKDAKLKAVNTDEGKTIYEGSEGSIWYLHEKETGLWKQYKCKPHQIEQIHWASDHIPSATCYMTAMNVLETNDEVTYESVVGLLLEEFDQEKIDVSKLRIMRAVTEVQEEVEFNRKVDELSTLDKFSIDTDLPIIMKSINKHFNRKDMQKVYSRVKMARGI